MPKDIIVGPCRKSVERRVRRLLRFRREGYRNTCKALRRLERLVDATDEEIRRADLSFDEVKLAVARDYGFNDWNELERRMEDVGRQGDRLGKPKGNRSGSVMPDFVDLIVEKAKEIYASNGGRPVRMADLATGGGHGGLPAIVEKLIENGVDYELVFTDIQPTYLPNCYTRFPGRFPESEVRKLKFVLVDLRDSRTELEMTRIYEEDGTRELSVNEAVKDPRFSFLSTGHENGRRTVSFEDESFDVLFSTGMGEMQADLDRACMETARLLRKGGYLVVFAGHIAKIRSYVLRTRLMGREIFRKPGSIRHAIETVRGTLRGIRRARRKWEGPEELFTRLGLFFELERCDNSVEEEDRMGMSWWPEQKGDLMRWHVAVFRKGAAEREGRNLS